MPVLWLQRGHFCTFAGLDPNRDPNAETTGTYGMDTVDRPPSLKHAKAPESVAAQRFPALIVSSHAGGHWFESSSLHQKVPDFVRNQELFLFMFSNSDAAFGRFLRDPKAERSGKHGRERRGRGCCPARPCAASPFYSFNPREYPTRTVWHSIQKKSMFFVSYPCY